MLFCLRSEGVTVAVKARVITVTGPRGTLQKSAQHVAMSIRSIAPTPNSTNKVQKVRLVVWHGGRKHVACLRTIRSQIENMIKGVQYGFAYKMRLVYAHFPINVIINDKADSVEIRNFLGEKIVRNVPMLEGVTIRESKNVKVRCCAYLIRSHKTGSISADLAVSTGRDRS